MKKAIEKNSDFLRILRVKNVNRLILGNLNINLISNIWSTKTICSMQDWYYYCYKNQIGLNLSQVPVYDRWL